MQPILIFFMGCIILLSTLQYINVLQNLDIEKVRFTSLPLSLPFPSSTINYIHYTDIYRVDYRDHLSISRSGTMSLFKLSM